MKRNTGAKIGILLVGLLIAGVIAFYIYDITALKSSPTDNLARVIMILLALCATLAKLLTGSGRKALNVYERAYKKELGRAFENNPSARKKLLRATRLYNESNYNRALKCLYQLLGQAETVSDRCPILLFIALCYTDAGVPDEAIETYRDLLKYDIRNAQAHSNLGALYVGAGDFELARRHYDCAITYLPNNYYGYINRANLLFRTGDYEPAMADAHRALEIKNNGKEAASLLTILYALAGDEENKRKYQHIAAASGADPKALNAAIMHYISTQSEE